MNKKNLLYVAILTVIATGSMDADRCYVLPTPDQDFKPYYYDLSYNKYCVRKNVGLAMNASSLCESSAPPAYDFYEYTTRSYDCDHIETYRLQTWQAGIKMWDWDFGDGSTYCEWVAYSNWGKSGSEYPDGPVNGHHKHTYTTSGYYTMYLSAQDDDYYEGVSSQDHWAAESYQILVFDMEISAGYDTITACNVVPVYLWFEPYPCINGRVELSVMGGDAGGLRVWADSGKTTLLIPQNGQWKCWWPCPVMPSVVYVEAIGTSGGTLAMCYVINDDDQVDSAENVSFKFVDVEVESVTSDKESAAICEDVTFTVKTDPPGYEAQVQWTGGGCPASQNGGATFTTKWPCIGQKEVTASCCGNLASKNVTVVLPTGCGMAEQHNTIPQFVPSGDNYYSATVPPYGSFSYPPATYEVDFKYANCAWVCQITRLCLKTQF